MKSGNQRNWSRTRRAVLIWLLMSGAGGAAAQEFQLPPLSVPPPATPGLDPSVLAPRQPPAPDNGATEQPKTPDKATSEGASVAPAPAIVEQPAAGEQTDPNSPERLAAPHIDEGYAELRSQNLKAAAVAFERALQINPQDRRARFGLGTTYISLKEYAKARDLLEGLANEFPDDYAVKNNLAWLFATSTDPSVRDGEKAIKYAQEVVIAAPRDFHVWSTLAEAYFIVEKYEEALRAANEALRLVRQHTRDPAVLKDYERQVAKCRLAIQALSILE